MKPPVVQATLGEHWGNEVVKRRKAIGLTQLQLAEACEVTQQAISKIESGKSIPHDKLKLVIANRLGIAPGKLFAWPPREALIEATR